MDENKVNSAEPMTKEGAALPRKVDAWTKIKNVLFYEIKVELTPKQEKVFKEVHDFWCQEITGQNVHDFLFYDITGEKVKNFLFQEIEITDNIEL